MQLLDMINGYVYHYVLSTDILRGIGKLVDGYPAVIKHGSTGKWTMKIHDFPS